MRFVWLVLALVSFAASARADASFTAAEPPAGAIWLESLDLSNMVTGLRPAMPGRSTYNHALTNNGVVYPHGIGTHPFSEFHVDLRRTATRFRALAAVDDEATEWADPKKPFGTVSFEVWVDGRKAVDTGVVRHRQEPRAIDVDVRGARRLVLIVRDGGDGNDSDNADWLGAFIELDPRAKQRPISVPRPMKLEPTMPLASGHSERLGVHGPMLVGTTPGKPFLHRVAVTGRAPVRIDVKDLPEGLSFDPSTRIISGSVARAGRTAVTIEASGPQGQRRRVVVIDAGPGRLALTPPMGWNHWNAWGKVIDAQKIRDAADQLIATGLADHGWQYVNVDDGWEGARGTDGVLRPNESFGGEGGMKALAAYVHGKGLKIGLYSSPGPKTCGGFEGSYGHEASDAQTFAAWGFDYLKHDWCSYAKLNKGTDRAALMAPYRLMREALDRQGRDVVLSLCQYGMGDVWAWGREVGQLWRTTGDITYTWKSVSDIGFGQDRAAPYGGRGGWNDPDLLVVGKMGWGRTLTPTQLTPNEQITHVTLWAILPAPLMLSADLGQLDRFTLDLLTNDEVLDVNQDPAGKPAERKWAEGAHEVWVRPLYDGTFAVAAFNRGDARAVVTIPWDRLGLGAGPHELRNLWTQKPLPPSRGSLRAAIAGHGALLLRVGRPRADASP